MGKFDKALDDCRAILRGFKGFEEAERVLAAAVEGQAVLDELARATTVAQGDLAKLQQAVASAKTAEAQRAQQAQADYERQTGELQRRLQATSEQIHEQILALTRRHDTMLNEHEITAAELNDRRITAQAELDAIQKKLEHARAELSGLMQRIA